MLAHHFMCNNAIIQNPCNEAWLTQHLRKYFNGIDSPGTGIFSIMECP